MTTPARITQDDMTRAAKAVRAAGLDRARIVMDLACQRIEIIIGESASAPAALLPEVWTDEDV